MAYVEVIIGNRNFFTGKHVIVKVNKSFNFVNTYKDEAFKIACNMLGLNQEECSILSWRYFGDDVTFIM
jgi:hypothetical protein